MKYFNIILIFILSMFGRAVSQENNPVKWSAVYKSINDKEGEVIISAVIDKGWHTYSQRATDAGPIPTSFKFTVNKSYSLVGKTEESNAHEEFVKAFDAKIFVFTDKAEFKQKIKLNDKSAFTIPLSIEYMCCNDLMCLPPKTIQLNILVK